MDEYPVKGRKRIMQFLVGVIAVASCVVVAAFLISPALADMKETKPVNTQAEIDEEMLSRLEAEGNAELSDVVETMQSVEESRSIVASESVSVEESIRESILESSLEEANSIEASLIESSIAESSSAAEYEALCAPLEGSHLKPFEVVYNCDDTDIPYIRKLFQNVAVVGNSRAKNIVDCGVLTSYEVTFLNGANIDSIPPYMQQAAYLYKPKALIIMGLNDLGYTKSDDAMFKDGMEKNLLEFMSINPDAEIYVQEILPVPEEARSFFWRMDLIPTYSTRLYELCEQYDLNYVAASKYADFEYINSEDHAHYGKEFYFLWAQTIASQLHLWEDLAGLDYEIPLTETCPSYLDIYNSETAEETVEPSAESEE